MFKFLISPTPRQLFYIIFAYLVITIILGYFLVEPFTLFIVCIGAIFTLNGASSLLKPYQSIGKFDLIFLPIGLVLFLLSDTHILKQQDFILDKSQLQHITATVPEHKNTIKVIKTNARTVYTAEEHYLTINGANFHCRKYTTDLCEKIFDYKNKTATIYYQANSSVGNLVYEIVVDGQAIYQFDQQLAIFQKQRSIENASWFFAILLYILPLIYLFYLYNQAIPIRNQELLQYVRIPYGETIITMRDLGVMGIISFIFAMISVMACCIALASPLFDIITILTTNMFLVFAYTLMLIISLYIFINDNRTKRLNATFNANLQLSITPIFKKILAVFWLVWTALISLRLMIYLLSAYYDIFIIILTCVLITTSHFTYQFSHNNFDNSSPQPQKSVFTKVINALLSIIGIILICVTVFALIVALDPSHHHWLITIYLMLVLSVSSYFLYKLWH